MPERAKLKGHDDRQEPGPVERWIMAFSVLLTVLLFGYVSWQAVTAPPTAEPAVDVVDVQDTPDGDVAVVVELVNAGGVGLLSITVEVDCVTPAPSLTFENVPAEGRRRGTLVCPPDTTDPVAAIVGWIEA